MCFEIFEEGKFPGKLLEAMANFPNFSEELWRRIGHSVYIDIDLEAISNNIKILKKLVDNRETGVIAVVKSNAYGHGAVPVARYLTKETPGLVDRFAVATLPEAIELRRSGIDPSTPIHLFGNVPAWAMVECLRYSIIPTLMNEESIHGMESALDMMRSGKLEMFKLDSCNNRIRSAVPLGAVDIKIDTGMTRNGCQPHELPKLIEVCNASGVPIDGIFSHFCNHEESGCSEAQLEIFNKTIQNYRNDGYNFHMANSGAILRGLATDLNFIRPGISIYGEPPDREIDGFVKLGFRPALSIKARPTLVKRCLAGRRIGYGCTYGCQEDEWIATFPIGYGDGYRRSLDGKKTCIVRDKTGERCPLVGRVSMDAITVRVPCRPDEDEIFTIVSGDYDPHTSVHGFARSLGTIEYEILSLFASRLPRVYRASANSVYYVAGAECLIDGPPTKLD